MAISVEDAQLAIVMMPGGSDRATGVLAGEQLVEVAHAAGDPAPEQGAAVRLGFAAEEARCFASEPS